MEIELVIGPATTDQRVPVAELWRRNGLTMPYSDPLLDFDRAFGGPASDVLVGTVGGRLVATVMVGHDGHRGWLHYVAVHLENQGGGVGRRMVAVGEDWLRARSILKVQLMVRATNEPVIAFYDRLAYERSDVRVMQKWLTSDGQAPG